LIACKEIEIFKLFLNVPEVHDSLLVQAFCRYFVVICFVKSSSPSLDYSSQSLHWKIDIPHLLFSDERLLGLELFIFPYPSSHFFVFKLIFWFSFNKHVSFGIRDSDKRMIIHKINIIEGWCLFLRINFRCKKWCNNCWYNTYLHLFF